MGWLKSYSLAALVLGVWAAVFIGVLAGLAKLPVGGPMPAQRRPVPALAAQPAPDAPLGPCADTPAPVLVEPST